MLGIVMGLGASVCWGLSDFLGGVQSRRWPQLGVMLAGGIVGCLVLGVSVAVSGAPLPAARYLLAGVAGGISVTIGLVAFYRGLAIGLMSVVAPIAATGAIVPVAVGVASGERPGVLRSVGAAVAIVGVVLVSRQQSDDARSAASMTVSVLLALVAALGFGGEFVALREAARGDPLWGGFAVVATYLALLTIAAIVEIGRGRRIKPGRSALPSLFWLGLSFGAANALYAIATRHGTLSAVAVAASLYPVVTVLLARFTLNERTSRVQEVGIVASVAGIVMIAGG